jgi:hypothetical protein
MRARSLAGSLAVALLGIAAAPPAEAAIAVLQNGSTLKVVAWRFDGESVEMRLADGGQVATPASAVRGFVPDELLDEVEQARQSGGDVESLLRGAAERHGLDPALVRAVVQVESAFQPAAVSPKGAQGLMQLMPETAAILGVRDPFNARQNIHGGTAHLRAMMERFRHDVRLAVAAYNAGEKPVAQYRGVPPYPKTREYVTQVMRHYHAAGEPLASARGEQRAGDVLRIVKPDGTVLYTNIAYGGPAALNLGR